MGNKMCDLKGYKILIIGEEGGLEDSLLRPGFTCPLLASKEAVFGLGDGCGSRRSGQRSSMAQQRHLLGTADCYKTTVEGATQEMSICRSASSDPRVPQGKVAQRPRLNGTQCRPHPCG